ncbi:oligo-1,6-glucosidase [Exiguobacterium indicum]|uniref:glycoside hydrolase family 13 protein n=1 Tax=Exiguobacterium indicum TaxID=296995 RepID=UPI00073758E6|nr:alpha-glucosidase [Exiguobacterium indicum]KTR60906.1 oligo-1,6-glucosidase [Exiguobacterium indicum]
MTQMIPRPETAQQTITRAWWKEAVAYQIYPRSFYDANNDGIGDIPGIIAKLDYLKDLGVDVLWICPMFKSPNDDNGYDISDYEDIMDEFGTMADFDLLMEEAHKRDIKVLLDLVVNHTSDEHPWFLESRSSKDNEKRDWYIWKDAVNGGEPNNWESIFGGSAWEYDEKTEQYFLHVFSRRQPDLNWQNRDMRQAVYTMINWWLDKGIDGFRIDAISHINKDQSFADLPNPLGMPYVPSFDMHMNVEGIHAYLEELKDETFSKYDIMTVGEANGVTPEEADLWVGEENGKMNMVFQFEHMDLWRADAEKGVDVVKLKQVLTKWQKGLEATGWNALYLENHDKVRSVSLWGDEEQYWKESAKSLAMMYFFMQGTPFIYQGQEIGMTNVQFPDISDYDDVATKNMYDMQLASGKTHEEIMEVIWNSSRDNSRTPMQWTNEQNGGFSNQSPWFGVNPNYADINVASQEQDEDSILNFYKRMIQIRKMEETLIYGAYDLILPEDTKVYAYTRTLGDEQFLIVTNLKGETAEIDTDIILHSDNMLLGNYSTMHHEGTELELRPFEARLYRVR